MLVRRIGGFFILIGAGLLLIFAASLQAGARDGFGFLLAGLAGIVVGALILSRTPNQAQTANRFRMLRRSREENAPEADE